MTLVDRSNVNEFLLLYYVRQLIVQYCFTKRPEIDLILKLKEKREEKKKKTFFYIIDKYETCLSGYLREREQKKYIQIIVTRNKTN